MEKSPLPLQESSPSVLAGIRLIATDMDGTLTDRGHFTPHLLQCLVELTAHHIDCLIVTGRSAGWVQGIVAYLPIAGAIAENGGVFIPKSTGQPVPLNPFPDLQAHRLALATQFSHLQTQFPELLPAADNPFRLTDWTFDIGTLTPADLQTLETLCLQAGWGFTYSTVQCHIRSMTQDKGVGLQTVLAQYFPELTLNQVVTVGDSPNDEGLFDAALFPVSVGVGNVKHYCDRLRHQPAFITANEEVYGFQELVQHILTQSKVAQA